MTERAFKERKIDSIVSDDGTLKFDFMTSLQNIVIAKILSNFWMNSNTKTEIINLFHSNIRSEMRDFAEKWQQIEDSIVAKISELSLPKSITKMLKSIVPIIGNSINNWIRHHDKCLFNTTEYSTYSAVDLISNITWTARGRIDYAQTAKTILDNQSSYLTEDHKYKLACTYCLEDEITALAPNVLNEYYLDNVKIGVHPMVYYWTSEITGDNTILNNPSNYSYEIRRHINEMSVNERIIYLLINICYRVSFNEVPIRYIWNKLSEEEKAKYITALVTELHNLDLRYTLLSNLDYDQQQIVFKECSCTILCGILNDWLWRKYFISTASHILDIMDPLSYLYILKDIIKQNIKNSQEENPYAYNEYNCMFKELWQKCPRNFKDFIFEHNNGRSLVELVMHKLSWKRDMDIIALIFNDLNSKQKKSLIFGLNGIGRCAYLIKNDEWDVLENFIKYTISSSEDIFQLKERLVKVKGQSIVTHFLKKKAFHKIENFMGWAFKSEEKIEHFRRSLAHTKIYESTLESIIASRKVDFTELDNHFRWCAKGNPEVIIQFKNKVPKLHSGKELICKLIQDDQYELLDDILNWCFCYNQEHIAQFKCDMYRDDVSLSPFVKSLIYILIVKDNSFKMLDKFIGWCFTTKQEVQIFKSWVLCEYCVCIKLLEMHQFMLADKFINWCDIPSEAVNEFKNAFMLSNDMKYILYHARRDTKSDLQLQIKWFNPSKETVQKFKTEFSEEECPKNFYKLLDEFIEKQNIKLISNDEENVSQDLQGSLQNQSYHSDGIQDESAIVTVGEVLSQNLTIDCGKDISKNIRVGFQNYHNGGDRDEPTIVTFGEVIVKNIIDDNDENISQKGHHSLENEDYHNGGTQKEQTVVTISEVKAKNQKDDNKRHISQNRQFSLDGQDYHNEEIKDEPSTVIIDEVIAENIIQDDRESILQNEVIEESTIVTFGEMVIENIIADDGGNISQNTQVNLEGQDYHKGGIQTESNIVAITEVIATNQKADDRRNIPQNKKVILEGQDYHKDEMKDEPTIVTVGEVLVENILEDDGENISQNGQFSLEGPDYHNGDTQAKPSIVTLSEVIEKNQKADDIRNFSQNRQVNLECQDYHKDEIKEEPTIVTVGEVLVENIIIDDAGSMSQNGQVNIEGQHYHNIGIQDEPAIVTIGVVIAKNIIEDDNKNMAEKEQVSLEAQDYHSDDIKDEPAIVTVYKVVAENIIVDDGRSISQNGKVSLEGRDNHNGSIQDEPTIVTIGEVTAKNVILDDEGDIFTTEQVRLETQDCHNGDIKHEPTIVNTCEVVAKK